MSDIEKVFFSILRAALWGTPVALPEGFSQWNAIMRLATSHALQGLVGGVLLTNEEIKRKLSSAFVERLQAVVLTSIGMYSQMNTALRQIVVTLREKGIEPVLLKGQGLAEYYPTPELRQCGDIDIYVGEDNYWAAYDAFYPISTEIDEKPSIPNRVHFHAKIGPIFIEVHRKADYMHSRKADRLLREYMLDGLSKNTCPLKICGVEVMTPNDTYNAFYIFHHLWRHFSTSGVGLRQFCDWARFLHTHVGKLDLILLRKMIEELGCMIPWQIFGCFLVNDLGLPDKEFPFYNIKYLDKVNKVRDYVMAGGNFGINSGYLRAYKHGYLSEKIISLKFHIIRYSKMFSIFHKHTIVSVYYMLRDGFTQIFKDILN